MAYIEYRIDNFGLQKHLPESKKNLYIEYFRLSILIRENIFFSGFAAFLQPPVIQARPTFLYCIKKMSFSGSPKGTPHDWCRRTMKKKLFCNENQWNWVVFLKKLMNIFTWDLYSMYVVLQGIGSLPCIKVYIIYVIPFGE